VSGGTKASIEAHDTFHHLGAAEVQR